MTAFVKDLSNNYRRKDYALKFKKYKKAVLANWVVPAEIEFGDIKVS